MAEVQGRKGQGVEKEGGVRKGRGAAGEKHSSEKAFRVGSYVLVVLTVICVPGFLKFRSWATENSILVLKAESIWWTIPGFLALWALAALLKSSPFQTRILSWLKEEEREKKEGEQYNVKLMQMTKAVRDTIVHFVVVVVTLYLFRREYWFSWLLGGSGDHLDSFREFPSWPHHLSTEIEIFFMVQLGMNLYLLLDLTLFNRKFSLTGNYYEMLLHHIATVSCIVFSTLCNISAVVTLIFFVHDVSDLFRAGSRVYCASRWAKFVPTLVSEVVFLVVWVYNRIIVYPYCLIFVLEREAHAEGEAMDLIRFEFWCLFTLYCSLYVLHVFWTYLLVRSTYKRALMLRSQQKEEKKALKKE